MIEDNFEDFDKNNIAGQILSQELLTDEKLLWVGQPEPKLFTGADFFLVPFTLIWAGGVTLALGASLMAASLKPQSSPEVPGLFYIPFLFMAIVGFYIAFGRFFYKSWKKKKTYYGITDKRVITVCMAPSKNTQAAFIDHIPTVNLSTDSKGIGTLIFGNSSPYMMMYANTGMDFFGAYMNSVPVFFDIKNANKVYQLVNKLRNENPN